MIYLTNMQYAILVLFSTLNLFASNVETRMYSEDDLNPDFILRSDLMPGSLLMIDNEQNNYILSNITNNSKNLQTEKSQELLSFNGSWFDAYSTMDFHRKMFNEYLCRNFVVKEILSDMQTPILSRRVGRPFVKLDDKEKGKYKRKDRNEITDDLLSDPGSSNYRNWLSKTTTLDDVYRHYDMAVTSESDIEDKDDMGPDYEGGEFTGYAMPGPSTATGKNDYNPPMENYYPNYAPPPPPVYFAPDVSSGDTHKHGDGFDYSPHHVHFHSTDNEKSHHGLALNDIFDIALTAIAFLSFGMFILQVIMCITMNKPMMAMMAMTDSDTESADVMDELRFKRRLRTTTTQNYPSPGEPIDVMRFKRQTTVEQHPYNELARRILISIDAGILANNDNGSCLRWSLCENNKYSRNLDNKQKYWIPIWGLGMSWLSGRLIRGSHTTSIMLESLRACALGLAQIECPYIYKNCDLRHLLEKR